MVTGPSDQWAPVGGAADNESLIEVADDLSSAPSIQGNNDRSVQVNTFSHYQCGRFVVATACVCVRVHEGTRVGHATS